MDFVPVVIIVGVIAFVAWREQEKIIAFFARFIRGIDRVEESRPEPQKPAPNPGTSAPNNGIRLDSSYANPTHDNITDRMFRPNAATGAVLESRVGGASYSDSPRAPVPAAWANARVVCDLTAGTYVIASDSPKHGYMVTGRAGGYDAMFNGTVGGTTLYPVNGLMRLTVDKACEAVFAPIVD